VLFLGIVEFLLLIASAELAYRLRSAQIDMSSLISDHLGELAVFAIVMSISMMAVGNYQPDGYRSIRFAVTRLAAAVLIAFVALSVLFYVFPEIALWRSISFYAFLIAIGFIVLARLAFVRLVGWERFRRRVVVLGAGSRGAQLEQLARTQSATFQVAEFIRMADSETAVRGALPRESVESLSGLIDARAVDEVVLALEERRGSLPVDELLRVKLAGVRVSEMTSFLERETGRIDLDATSPSWLIFSDGFLAAGQLAIMGKRAFDIGASLLLLILSSPVLLVTAILVKVTSPGPVFYRQERVGQFGKSFYVIKFRSMRNDAEKGGPQWAQQSDPRVTAVGRVIRALRIDEIPQIFCVLKGEMSFVGPRPERPFFVEDLAKQLPFYNERHIVKPGITGWAQLNYPYGASVEDARHKLEYDLYYVKNYSLFLDFVIIIQTVRVVLWRDGVR
jgi:sugar transferase (PEP-CTERM system associated)